MCDNLKLAIFPLLTISALLLTLLHFNGERQKESQNIVDWSEIRMKGSEYCYPLDNTKHVVGVTVRCCNQSKCKDIHWINLGVGCYNVQCEETNQTTLSPCTLDSED